MANKLKLKKEVLLEEKNQLRISLQSESILD